MKRRLLTLSSLAALLLAGVPTPSAAAFLHVNSETIIRLFERETPADGKKSAIPAYEYLALDLGNLDGDGVTGSLYGWGRHDFGDFYEDREEGALLYGYVQYRRSAVNLTARLGRQAVLDGVAGASMDGLRVGSDLGRYFSWSAYAGKPVALEAVAGSSGDSIWGAMLSHGMGGFYNLALSFKRSENDGEADEELIGFDGTLTALGPLSLHGRSVRNQLDKNWQRHHYEARLALGSFHARYTYQMLDYDSFFSRETATVSTPFSDPLGGLGGLGQSGEAVTINGGELSWEGSALVDFGARARNYSYDLREKDANYYSGVATVHLGGLSECGFELGRMEGGVDADTYTLGRAYAYYEMTTIFFTGDLVYAKYGETIFGDLGDSRSIFASLGGGMRFLKDSLKVKASLEYSRDPYFADDVRGILALEYDFSK